METAVTLSLSADEGPQRKKIVTISSLEKVSEETSGTSTSSSSFVECPKQKVGSIRPIILSVIGYLNLPEQKSCRLVNKLWDKTASVVMLQQDKSQVNVVINGILSLVFNQVTDAPARLRMLNYSVSNLVELMKNSTNFPCTSFSFLDGTLDYTPVHQLFSWGQKIKTLHLRGSCIINTSESTFRKILLQLTNLEKLGITDFCHNWGSNDKEDPLQLSNLKIKYLTVTSREPVDLNMVNAVKEIVLTSPNLTEIQLYGFTLFPLDVFVQTNTLHLISYGNWTSNCIPDFNDKVFDNVIMPRLACLKVFFSIFDRGGIPLKRKMESYSKILMSSQHSLKELDICLGNPMEGLHFPILQNLKKLIVHSLNFSCRLPFGKQLDVVFPNVTTLVICDSHLPPLPSIKIGPLSSVTTIEILHDVHPTWLQILQSFCPNMKTLAFWSRSLDFKKMMTAFLNIWHETNDRALEEVIIYCSARSPNLDSILTGLTQEDLTKLKAMSCQNITESLNKFPRVSSLLNIAASTKLTFLITNIRCWSNVTSLPFSEVGITCAFQIRPNVIISIGYDENQKTPETDYLQKLKALRVNIFHYKHNPTPYFIFPEGLGDSSPALGFL